MKAPGPPKWLTEIREYWSEMTTRLADETGRPVLAAPETGFSELPERPSPLHELQRPEAEPRLVKPTQTK
jgi:hypothetical protein